LTAVDVELALAAGGAGVTTLPIILVADEEFVLITVPLTILITVVEVDGAGRATGAATILDAVHMHLERLNTRLCSKHTGLALTSNYGVRAVLR
jgi:hypothetical protein